MEKYFKSGDLVKKEGIELTVTYANDLGKIKATTITDVRSNKDLYIKLKNDLLLLNITDIDRENNVTKLSLDIGNKLSLLKNNLNIVNTKDLDGLSFTAYMENMDDVCNFMHRYGYFMHKNNLVVYQVNRDVVDDSISINFMELTKILFSKKRSKYNYDILVNTFSIGKIRYGIIDWVDVYAERIFEKNYKSGDIVKLTCDITDNLLVFKEGHSDNLFFNLLDKYKNNLDYLGILNFLKESSSSAYAYNEKQKKLKNSSFFNK